MQARPRRVLGWLRRMAYLALAAGLVAPIAYQMLLSSPAPVPEESIPPALQAVLDTAFSNERCMSAEAAADGLRRQLDQHGLSEWSVDVTHVTPTDCVTWSLQSFGSANPHTITLIGTLSPTIREALRSVREDTFQRCLTKDEALSLVSATLEKLGQKEFELRTDGPFQVPLDRQDEVIRHYDAGCWMYSTFGWIDGKYMFYLSGKEGPPAS